MTGGDFVRNVKQVIDLLRQIADVAPEPATAAAARAAADRCRRGVVAASSTVVGPGAPTTGGRDPPGRAVGEPDVVAARPRGRGRRRDARAAAVAARRARSCGSGPTRRATSPGRSGLAAGRALAGRAVRHRAPARRARRSATPPIARVQHVRARHAARPAALVEPGVRGRGPRSTAGRGSRAGRPRSWSRRAVPARRSTSCPAATPATGRPRCRCTSSSGASGARCGPGSRPGAHLPAPPDPPAHGPHGRGPAARPPAPRGRRGGPAGVSRH